MSDLNKLEQWIKDKLAVTEQRRRLKENHLQKLMVDFEQGHQQFVAAADRLVETVLGPALRKLTDCFGNAELECDSNGRHHCVCTFHHSDRFPAHVKLELAVSRDGQCETLLLLYDVEILPVFFQFQHEDRLGMPLGSVSDEQAAAWVEKKIVEFVETYLRLETVDQYHTENMVLDPVCGMRINKTHAPAKMEYNGQKYYFCLEECRRKFAAQPSQYLAAGSAKP
jgi:YHS domain-containing protein